MSFHNGASAQDKQSIAETRKYITAFSQSATCKTENDFHNSASGF